MKSLLTVFAVILAVVLCFPSSSNAGEKTMIGGILQIPKASTAPTIDGVLDPIWKNVTAYPLLKPEGGTNDTLAAKYMDHFTTFRLMWDADNFYAFVSVVDDTLNTVQTAPYFDDCVELFFDGFNSKFTNHGDGDSSVQWRWVYDIRDTSSLTISSGFRGPGTWKWLKTNSGFNFELAIPKASLGNKAPLEDDHVIGFEISNNDNDNATDAQHVLHWWTTNGNTWANPSLYGTAILSSTEVSDMLVIPKTDTPPTLNGVMGDGEWDIANEISLNQHEGDPAHPESTYTRIGDHITTAFTMWDADNFYAFVKVIDDTLNTVQTAPYFDDCVELFFDGYNAKLTNHGNGDSSVQWRWVYGIDDTSSLTISSGFKGPGSWKWLQTTNGFNLELAIPKASLGNKCPLVDDQVIGFEISNNDNDNATSPQHVLHWWTTNGNTWANPSLYGTALLKGGPGAVAELPTVVTSYELGQNYPNPFNPSTNITFALPKSERVKLAVYNLLGKEVAVLANGVRSAGPHMVSFNAGNLASGVYFYKLQTETTILTKKMVFIK